MRLIPYSRLIVAPWKNGGGETREIAAFPPGAGFDDFDWRLSIATIAEDGAFSAFPGIDRTLILLSGNGVALRLDDGGAMSCNRASGWRSRANESSGRDCWTARSRI